MQTATGDCALSRVAGPDFICIGMPKAGTGWLFDQLQYHPDFWMPPIKEIHYLNREFPRMPNAARHLEKREEREQGLRPKRGGDAENLLPTRRPGDARDAEFLKDAVALSNQPRDIEKYCALFRFKEGLLSGDISPDYCELEDDVIAQIAETLPETKIVLLVRDPVARAWSRISMSYRRGNFDEGLLNSADDFRNFLENSNAIQSRSLPSKIVDRWKRAAPKMQFRHFMFDDIAGQPETARHDICVFLGADPDKTSASLPAGYNRKAKAAKLEMTDTARAVLVEYFRAELKACAQMFGAHAQQWAQSYGVQ